MTTDNFYDAAMASSYHHGNLRSALIDAGVELARESGADGVVVREAARRTGVSHNAAYRHFADREELVAEVAAVSLAALADAMSRKINRVREQDPRARSLARLRAVGRAYVEFALREPGLFLVAFVGPPIDAAVATSPYEVLGSVLDECLAAGAMAAAKRPGAEISCWSAVHGFAMLHLNGPLSGTPKRTRDRLLDAMLSGVEDALAAGLDN